MCKECWQSCDCDCQKLLVIADTDDEGHRHDKVGCTECHHEVHFQ